MVNKKKLVNKNLTIKKNKIMAKKTAVAITNNNISAPATQKEIPATIEALKAQLASKRKGIDEGVSLDISYNGKNIKSINSVGELMQISSSVKARSEAYDEAIKRHKLENANIAEFTHSGKNAEEWMKIIDKAAFNLINAVEISNLESTISDLSECLDAESKLAMKIQKAMALANQPIK